MNITKINRKNNEIIIDDKELKLIIKSLNCFYNNNDDDEIYFLSRSLVKLFK